MSGRLPAARILLSWLRDDAFPDRELAKLPQSSGATHGLVLGIVKRARTLDWLVERQTDRPPREEARVALWIGLYELLFLTETPAHAAVSEAVEVAKRIASEPEARFVNAVLRRVSDDPAATRRALGVAARGVILSHPNLLLERWDARFGAPAVDRLCEWNNEPAEVTVHPNLLQHDEAAFLAACAAAGIALAPHPAGRGGHVLPPGVTVTDLPGYADGAVIVQDPSTRMATELLAVQPGQRVVDGCAAPGGKLAALAAALRGSGTLVAVDRHGDRVVRLRENVARWRLAGVETVVADFVAWSAAVGPTFDRVLLDVPCTNTGVLRRRADARWRFDAERLRLLTGIQRRLLEAGARCLAPGGRLVYSTCSLEAEENERQVGRWLRRHTGFRLVEERHSLPPGSRCDGAYAAAIEHART